MWIGSVLREDGQPAAAVALQAEMLRQLHARLASTHPDFAVLEAEFGRSLLDAGRYAEARQHLQLAREACGVRFGTAAWQCAEIDRLLRGVTRA
jgi:hypothetical protein